MGNSVSRVVGCFVATAHDRDHATIFFADPALDEGLGHSFCYVRPSLESLHLSPSHSDRYTSGVDSSDFHSSSFRSERHSIETVAFKSISGASVSANTSTPHTILSHEQLHSFTNVPDDRHAAFESTPSFTSLPLQPVPRGVTFSGPFSGTFSGPISGPLQDRSFMSGPVEAPQRGLVSGPLERVFMSGPIERGHMSGPIDIIHTDRTHFSAPLTGSYQYRRRRRKRNISRLFSSVGKPVKGAFTRTISSTLARTHRSIVVPVRQFVWRRLRNGGKEAAIMYDSPRYASSDADLIENQNLQWAQGKAGEDRVHVVVSEDHGWLFVGIYDGFNGPDAPDFLMRNLYKAVYKELQGLLWDVKDNSDGSKNSDDQEESSHVMGSVNSEHTHKADSVTQACTLIPAQKGVLVRSRTLKDFLENADIEVDDFVNGASLKQEIQTAPKLAIKQGITSDLEKACQERLVCNHSIDEQSTINNCAAGDCGNHVEEALSNEVKFKRGTTLVDGAIHPAWPILRHRQIKSKESHRKFLPRRHDTSNELTEHDNDDHGKGEHKLWGGGNVDHDAVLSALARALEATEEAYLIMADRALEENPELALMGSCILVALMKGKDVFILNVGDSRAIVAQERKSEHCEIPCNNIEAAKRNGSRDSEIRQDLECISEESPTATEFSKLPVNAGPPALSTSLSALQLSMDHSTSIEAEVQRIKSEHPDDKMCILNDRVKGRLKVTRAFGAGFLKKPRWNNAILKMFQIDYVGSAPYVSCAPALHHHRLGPHDRFLILSSDGLYQYFSNEEVVSHVEWFMENFPEGDPAQHLIEQLLFRAAKKAGMDFHELLDIPQGDRRKYHDDVSVMVISLEGRVWKSSG